MAVIYYGLRRTITVRHLQENQYKRSVVTELSKGFEAFNQANYQLAHSILLPFAEKGNPYAQVHIGYLYLKGLHVEQNRQIAEHWLSKASSSNNNDVQKLIDIIDKELDIESFAELNKGFG